MLPLAAPAGAQVREGVEAWSRGDYAAAVAQWQAPAEAGDADALFNLAQAYRLGRGVPQDEARAEALYAQAAQAGHVQAADTYGLMLFQDGRREEALPYVQGAASRGDPRAQYLLGIAHFNGDIVSRDWTRAYALLTLANAAGLPQASSAITQMDQHIPIDQRQAAAGLARQLEADAERARAVELAAADLGAQAPVSPAPPPSSASPRVPRPIPTVDVSPSIAAARDAVRQAREATGAESPADAGASFANSEPRSAPPPARVADALRPAAPAPEIAAPARDLTSGPWRVQLGAFGVAGNAQRLWNRLSSRPEIAGRERLLISTGRVTRLQAGGYATRDEAQRACNSLRSAGVDCLVRRD
ncbi:SPOR domain-containing protein [Erythrobacter sp. JGD-13]|uniref:SPOR domain-containing protein n=2 Tax=Aurantiacibacter sediminis TaxID=2793064 RepID=A0ABS0N6G6_9SPHN|nr:SPOR domain-containing protein [Aurantiacibacter sediminis]